MEKNLKQQKSDCIKIVLFGPESTGKTTLAKQLAEHYNTVWVPEYSRTYAEEKLKENTALTKKDVLPIAIGQISLENDLVQKAKTVLICDTNLLETKIYSEAIYDGFCPEEVKKYAIENHYDLYLLTDIDIPWEKDEVRSSLKERNALFKIFKNTLEKHQLPYVLINGNQEKRLNSAILAINLRLNETVR